MYPSDPRILNAMDLNAAMAAEMISQAQNITPCEALKRFLASKTGADLYDDSLKLWWDGPAVLTELYRKENVHQS